MPDPFISLICPYCGSNLQRDEKRNLLVCPACGSEHLIKENVGSLTPPPRENINTCPRCMRNDQVMKVSAILGIQVQESKGTASVPTLQTDYKGRIYSSTQTIYSHATQMSNLVQRLRMPDLPPEPNVSGCLTFVEWLVYIITAGIAFLFLMALFSLANSSSPVPIPCMVSIIILFIIFIVLSNFLNRRNKKIRHDLQIEMNRYKNEILPKWKRAQERWNKAYYCGRDDLVFMIDEETAVDAERFSTWLIETTPEQEPAIGDQSQPKISQEYD